MDRVVEEVATVGLRRADVIDADYQPSPSDPLVHSNDAAGGASGGGVDDATIREDRECRNRASN